MSPVPDWYFAWAADHCTAFGFGPKDVETVAAWGPVFGSLFTAAELRAATGRLLASGDPLRFASDHRGAVIRAVESLRRASLPATTSTAPSGCGVCGGCGIVVVPHPGLTDDGRRWRPVLLLPDADPGGLTRTAGVSCTVCEPGRNTRAATEGQGRPILTFAQYEHAYPYWREVQFERERVLAAAQAEPSATDLARLNRLLADARERERRKAG